MRHPIEMLKNGKLKIIDNTDLQILLNNNLEWLEKQYFIKNITLEKDQGNTKYKITNLGKEYYYPYKLFLKTEWKWYIPLILSTVSIFINIIKLFIS